jgi:CYTH domain-containing protein
MAQEIERRFLVKDMSWRQDVVGTEYKQAYLASDSTRTVRVRIAGDKAYLTIKGRAADGEIGHAEFEYEIPVDDAEYIFSNLCEPWKIEKTRYKIPHENHIWEVDIFHGQNEGLITTEIELSSEDEAFAIPEWVGDEVTHDSRYINVVLAKNPFTTWA